MIRENITHVSIMHSVEGAPRGVGFRSTCARDTLLRPPHSSVKVAPEVSSIPPCGPNNPLVTLSHPSQPPEHKLLNTFAFVRFGSVDVAF